MADLETQLRQYAKGVLDHVEPVRADEITTTERLPRGRRGRTRVAVAVAASVLLMGSGALWIVSRGSGDQVRVTSQSGAFPGPTQWTQTGALDTELGTITSVPGGIVATGYGGIWFSSDARHWTNVLTPERARRQASYVRRRGLDRTRSGSSRPRHRPRDEPRSGRRVDNARRTDVDASPRRRPRTINSADSAGQLESRPRFDHRRHAWWSRAHCGRRGVQRPVRRTDARDLVLLSDGLDLTRRITLGSNRSRWRRRRSVRRCRRTEGSCVRLRRTR